MEIKRNIINLLAGISYFFYLKYKKNNIVVYTIEETIEELINSDKSMIRFGDGEIRMICGKDINLQKAEPKISEGLKRMLAYHYDDLVIAIPDIFNDLSLYRKESRYFWKEHLLFYRKIYERNCNLNRKYYNSLISRFYYVICNEERYRCEGWAENIRKIWKGKNVVIVEGERTHNGVGNNLFDEAKTIERIIAPSSNAYYKLEEILNSCRMYSKDRLFLVSLGIAAKFIVERLYLEGYRALDIGNLDMEYEWFLQKAEGKIAIRKHGILGEENVEAGYLQYLNEIKWKID